jgi:ribosome-binding protein aMBF1 (putative translation factor)
MIAAGVSGNTTRCHEVRSVEKMNVAKRKRIEAAGWSVGSTADFLELSPEEAAFIELKLRLSESLRKRRTRQNLSQTALAKKLKSSQSRVAKMEAGDPSVSVDLLLKALLATGATRNDLARVFGPRGSRSGD